MGGDAPKPAETSSWEARIERAAPQIGDAWSKTAAPSNPDAVFKSAQKSLQSLEELASRAGANGGDIGRRELEKARTHYALFPDSKDRKAIKDELLSYYKSENKVLYDALKRLDSTEAQLVKLGPRAHEQLAQFRKQMDEFYNPYAKVVDASSKLNLPVFFPKDGDSDFLKGPYVYLVLGKEREKVYLKDKTDPQRDIKAVATYNEMIKQFPQEKDKYGAERIDLRGNSSLEIKVQFLQNDTKYELVLDVNRALSDQLADARSNLMSNLRKDYNLDFAAEGSMVFYRGNPTGRSALAPTIPQLLALEDGLARVKTNFPVGAKPLRVLWTDLGVDGIFSREGETNTIYLSPKTDVQNKRAGWDVSAAAYVAIHELGHFATSSLMDQLRQTAYIAEAFGWSADTGQEMLKGADGSKYCFSGYQYNAKNPLAPNLDLDKWQKGCPTNGARLYSFLFGSNDDYPVVDRNTIAPSLKRSPFTGYYWNIEETAVEALTAYQAGGTSSKNLAQANPEAFERAMKLDDRLIARHTGRTAGESPTLVRMPDGKLAAATEDNLAAQKTWIKSLIGK